MKTVVLKNVLIFIAPVLLIFMASRIYRSGGAVETASGCNMSAKEYLETDTRQAIIIDVRTQREFDRGHLENAIIIDVYQKDFKKRINELDKNKSYFVYCKTGIRSRKAVNYMLQSGFKKVCNLEGGINYLTGAGVKLVR
ncbi:MAG: rhodanese-like domain-containing protein [Cytophagales bacterium]|nr:rhodanese-like domain-containing protein [Cytophagales bacterium]